MAFDMETRVDVKYHGRGTIKTPPRAAMDEPHFEDDYYIVWDDGHKPMWVGPSSLDPVST